MFKKIVLATDFTPTTDAAIDAAREFGVKFGAEIIVVHAVEPLSSEINSDVENEASALYNRLQEQAETKGKNLLDSVREAGVKASIRAVIGRRWEAIVKCAEDVGADLIVMGSKTIHEGEKVYLGSTSHKVFLVSKVPVLVMR